MFSGRLSSSSPHGHIPIPCDEGKPYFIKRCACYLTVSLVCFRVIKQINLQLYIKELSVVCVYVEV